MSSRPDIDDLKRQSGEAAAKGLDMLEDPEVVTAIERFARATLNLIETAQAKGLSAPETASFVSGTFGRVLYDSKV